MMEAVEEIELHATEGVLKESSLVHSCFPFFSFFNHILMGANQ